MDLICQAKANWRSGICCFSHIVAIFISVSKWIIAEAHFPNVSRHKSLPKDQCRLFLFSLALQNPVSQEILFVIKDLQHCFFSLFFFFLLVFFAICTCEVHRTRSGWIPTWRRNWNVLASASPPTFKSWPIKFSWPAGVMNMHFLFPDLFRSLRKEL